MMKPKRARVILSQVRLEILLRSMAAYSFSLDPLDALLAGES